MELQVFKLTPIEAEHEIRGKALDIAGYRLVEIAGRYFV
jgi:hypothetical protein